MQSVIFALSLQSVENRSCDGYSIEAHRSAFSPANFSSAVLFLYCAYIIIDYKKGYVKVEKKIITPSTL